MKPVVKPSFKRIFQLHPSAYCSQLPRPLLLTKGIQKEQKNSRFVQPFSLTLQGRKIRDNEEVRPTISRCQLQNQAPGLLTPSPLTKTTWSKVVRTTKLTTSSTEAPYWRIPSLDNKALHSRAPSTPQTSGSIWPNRLGP